MTAAGGAEQRVGAPARTAYLLLIVPPLCWAGNFVVGRAIHAEIPPAALTFWRWAVAAAVLLPLAGLETWRAREAIRRQWPLLTMLALTGVVGFQFVVYQGLHSTTAINGVLIIATIPAVIPAIAFALDGERITRRQGLGIVLSSLGVAIIVLRGNLAAALALGVAAGDLWIASAVPMWALYSVLVRRKDPALPPLVLLLAIVGIGLAVVAPGYAVELAMVGGFAPTPSTLAAIAYVGIAASVLAFWCWNRGIAGVGASRAGLYLHLMPVFAALLAVAFLDERLYAYHGVGMALVATGLVLSSTGGGRGR